MTVSWANSRACLISPQAPGKNVIHKSLRLQGKEKRAKRNAAGLQRLSYPPSLQFALRQPESSAGPRVCGTRPAANTLLAGLTTAPAAETRHGPHQARGRGAQLRDRVGFGQSLGQSVPCRCFVFPSAVRRHKRAPGTTRWPAAAGRGPARELTPPPPPLLPAARGPALPGYTALTGITGRRRAAGTAPPCDSAARRAPTWSGPGRDGQAASRAGAAAQPEQEAEEAPAGVRRGTPVLRQVSAGLGEPARGRPFPAVRSRGCRAEEPAQPGAGPGGGRSLSRFPCAPDGSRGVAAVWRTAAREPGISKAEREAGSLGSDFQQM